MHPHFAGEVGQNGVTVFQFSSEGRGWKRFGNGRSQADKALIGTTRRRSVRSLVVLDVADGLDAKR